jgi:hypothetical protein
MKKKAIITAMVLLLVLGLMGGSSIQKYAFAHSKDVIIKNITTTHFDREYQGVGVTANITYLWSNTYSEREDESDERICIGTKLHLAFMEAVKEWGSGLSAHKELERIPLFVESISKHFIGYKNPFAEGRDWITLDIRGIQFKDECGSSHTIDTRYGVVKNPYYADNYYFVRNIFPDK